MTAVDSVHPDSAEALLMELIPHAPNLGVYVDPHIPAKLLHNAIADYAPEMASRKVFVLLDLTLLKNAKDGALFGPDMMVFQNNDLEQPQIVAYRDIVGAQRKRGFFTTKLILSVNSGRATFETALNFPSGTKTYRFFQRFFEAVQLMPG